MLIDWIQLDQNLSRSITYSSASVQINVQRNVRPTTHKVEVIKPGPGMKVKCKAQRRSTSDHTKIERPRLHSLWENTNVKVRFHGPAGRTPTITQPRVIFFFARVKNRNKTSLPRFPTNRVISQLTCWQHIHPSSFHFSDHRANSDRYRGLGC